MKSWPILVRLSCFVFLDSASHDCSIRPYILPSIGTLRARPLLCERSERRHRALCHRRNRTRRSFPRTRFQRNQDVRSFSLLLVLPTHSSPCNREFDEKYSPIIKSYTQPTMVGPPPKPRVFSSKWFKSLKPDRPLLPPALQFAFPFNVVREARFVSPFSALTLACLPHSFLS